MRRIFWVGRNLRHKDQTMVLGPTLRKILPYINFAVATSALGFQVCQIA